MELLAVVLALGASCSWGVADFLGGLKSRGLPLLTVLFLSQLAGLVLMLVLVVVRGAPMPGADQLAYAVAAGLAGVIALAAFYRGMAVGAIGVVAPISATGAAVPVLVGLANGERASALQGLGIVLAMAGVVLTSRGQGDGPGARRRGLATGVGYALVAALGFGLIFTLLPQAARSDVYWAALVMRAASVLALLAAFPFARPRLAVGWSQAPALATLGVLDVGANVLYASASALGIISLVAVLASLYPVVTVALARLVLAERLARGQQAGVAAALAGVALIAAG